MKERILVIYDGNEEYAKSLMGYLNRSEGFPFETRLVTSLDNLRLVLNEASVEVLLLDDSWKVLEDLQAKHVLYLSETVQPEDERCVYRYQTIDNIIGDILNITEAVSCVKETAIDEGSQSEFRITAVYSPAGGCGKTTFSKEIARRYGELGRTLYLNIDLVGNVFLRPAEVHNDEGSVRGVEELLYFIKERRLDIESGLKEYFYESNHVYYLGESVYMREFWNLGAADIEYLFQCIEDWGEFQGVVLDINILNEAMIMAMHHCREIYLITPTYGLAREKIESFYAMLEFCQQGDLREKIKEVSVHNFNEWSEVARHLAV